MSKAYTHNKHTKYYIIFIIKYIKSNLVYSKKHDKILKTKNSYDKNKEINFLINFQKLFIYWLVVYAQLLRVFFVYFSHFFCKGKYTQVTQFNPTNFLAIIFCKRKQKNKKTREKCFLLRIILFLFIFKLLKKYFLLNLFIYK